MLKRVEIENFRALRGVDVPLRPLTVLIGANDTGKSSFLDALQSCQHGGNGTPRQDWWKRHVAPSIQAYVDGRTRYIRRYDSGGRLVDWCWYRQNERTHNPQDPSLGPHQFLSTTLLKLPNTGPTMTGPGESDARGAPSLQQNGSGVPALLDYLLRRDPPRNITYVEAACAALPGLKDIHIGTPNAQNRAVELQLEDGFILPADRASAGVRLMLFFLALVMHPSPPRLILLEEPENGVHPRRLAEVMRLLRSLTEGQYGDHAAQVILSTHSPYLLDQVDVAKDQVLVFQRNDDGSRTASPVDSEGLQVFLDEFMLGEVWYNEGEAGLVAHA